VRNDDAALMEPLSASAILEQTAKPKPIPIQGQLL
jgi:hypothetical protein